MVNGGSIEREYAIGRGRMDLCLRYAGETLAIEIKVWRPGRPDLQAAGLSQLDGYLAELGLPLLALSTCQRPVAVVVTALLRARIK